MAERKRKPANRGSMIGWVIFLLVMAGGPILRTLQGLIGSSVRLTDMLPFIVGGLVLLSIAVSVVRALGGRQAGGSAWDSAADSRLPERAGPYMPSGSPLPPFGGGANMPPLPPLIDQRRSMPQLTPRTDSYRTPQFEPLFSPAIVVLGLFGLLMLGGAAFVVFGGLLP